MLGTNVTKVGNSFYILIPSYLVQNLKIENGQQVDIIVEPDSVIFKIAIIKSEGV